MISMIVPFLIVFRFNVLYQFINRSVTAIQDYRVLCGKEVIVSYLLIVFIVE